MHAGRLIILFHPLQEESYILVKELIARGYTRKVDLLPAYMVPPNIRGIPWSTPALYTLDGDPIAISPLSAEEAINIMEGRWAPGDMRDDDLLISSVVKSPYASAIALVWESLLPLIRNCGFLKPALRLPLRNLACERVSRELEAYADELYNSAWRGMIINLASSLTFDYLTASGFNVSPDELEKMSYKIIALWLLSKASIGWVGAPLTKLAKKIIDNVSDYIATRSYQLLDSVYSKIQKIMSDKEYMELVETETGWFYPYLMRNHSR